MANRFGLNRTLGGAIGLIALIALLSGAAVLVTLEELNQATEARFRARKVVTQLDAFRIAMLNQETGVRGYAFTGMRDSLVPYDEGRKALDAAITALRTTIGDNTTESTPLAEAEAAARRWQSEVADPIVRDVADTATRPTAVAIEASGTGKRYFDVVRTRLDAVQDVEEKAFAEQNKRVAAAESRTTTVMALGMALTLAMCLGVGLGINRLVVRPLLGLASAMRRIALREPDVPVPALGQRNEVGAMARAVEVFKQYLVELERTSLLRVTSDTLPALVGYVDAQQRIGFLNGEFGEWFDLGTDDVAELTGRPLAQVFEKVPFPGTGSELDAAFRGIDTRFEYQMLRRGKSRRDLEAYFRPHRAPNGEVLGVVTLLTDITGRKRMERRMAQSTRDLMRSNEELEQFAYVASHDLKAPLRGIENLVSWIEEDLETVLQGDTRTNMDLLKSRVRRLESLLDDLLAYSRAGRADEAASERVDTRALVAELALLVSPPEGFAIVAEPSLPSIVAPRAPLTQVFQNLIGNAIKHHDRQADGHIWVSASTAPDGVEFVVTDDGPGIPERFRERVFGMFQTLRPRDEVEGSGMGLAIVKKLIERRGGRVWLGDGRGGRGLAVHFTWPSSVAGGMDGADG